MEKLILRYREWRKNRLEDKLEDAEEDFRKWSFAMKPSERKRAQRKIESLRQRVGREQF